MKNSERLIEFWRVKKHEITIPPGMSRVNFAPINIQEGDTLEITWTRHFEEILTL